MAGHRHRPVAPLRLLGVALALAALLAAVAAAPAMAVPRTFWGVVPQSTPSEAEMLRLKRGGVDSIRLPIGWNSTQPTPGGGFDWSDSDPVVARAAAAGIEVLPFLSSAPSWAVPQAPVPGTRGTASAPRTLPVRNARQRVAWKRFVIAAIQRYGPRGSLWAENPGLPRRPIRFWQVWNEPNFKYFVARPNPADYGKLVKLTYGAAKAADRGARIVLGGLFSRPGEARIKRGPKQAYIAADFLNRMYRSTPGVQRKFHGVALHPYTGTHKRVIPYIRQVRRVMAAHRDAGKGMWVTELTWSSEPRRTERDGFAKGVRGQARELKGAFRLLRNNQRRLRLKRVYWFSIADHAGLCNFCDGSGLFRDGFIPKPAWYAYARFAGGRPG